MPDGLEPIDDTNTFESIEMIRGYRDGLNLVIAKPKTVNIAPINAFQKVSASNSLNLHFEVTTRLKAGNYPIYAALSFDNNESGVDENGIPSGVWSDINTDAKNHPALPTRFTKFNDASFTIYPPQVLLTYKETKLSSEPDSKYASNVGRRAFIGDHIDYRLQLNNDSTQEITTLQLIDILPYANDTAIVPNFSGQYVSRGSKFPIPLLSVEDNEKFDIYYSLDPVKPTIDENKNATWLSSVTDYSKVTMIKAVMKPGKKLAIGEHTSIVMHNYIPADGYIREDDLAYNSFAIGLNNGLSFEEALKAEVRVVF